MRISLLIVITLIFTSCTTPVLKSSRIIMGVSEDYIPPETLSKNQVDADISVVYTALKMAYAGNKHFSEAEIKRILAKLNKIKKQKITSSSELCKHLNEVLMGLNDSHLNVHFFGKEKCETELVDKSVLLKKWKIEREFVFGQTILTLVLNQFPDPRKKDWDKFSQLAYRLRSKKAFIIDLRNFSRGWGAPIKFISFLTSKNLNMGGSWINTSAYSQAFRLNQLILRDRLEKSKISSRIVEGARLRYNRASTNNDNKDWRLHERLKVKGSWDKEYKGRIAVLIDESCSASCEQMVLLLKQLEGTVLFGTPTKGAFHFGRKATAFLTFSKLLFDFGTRYYMLPDGTFIEGKGILPDISVEEGVDSKKLAIKHIQKILDPRKK